MVLESLMDPFKAKKRPWELFFVGFIYSSVAVFLSLWVFRQYPSLVMVFLTVLACVPLIFSIIKSEEKKDMLLSSHKTLLKEHSRALSSFVFLFFGITLSFSFWYVVLPSAISVDLFSIQVETISRINTNVSGASVSNMSFFTKIFFNNVKVLVFCILFAFVYGLGAIFILVWNASVIGAAIGNFIRTNLATLSSSVGLSDLGSYFKILSLGILRYSIHGIPEILAYFTAGLAGGIISIAVVRHHYKSKKFENVLLDSSELIALSILFLFIAAFLEVFLTPIFF